MIATKCQLVRLTFEVAPLGYVRETARVLSLVYLDQPEGQRGVQLDAPLAGSRWWLESALEAAPK